MVYYTVNITISRFNSLDDDDSVEDCEMGLDLETDKPIKMNNLLHKMLNVDPDDAKVLDSTIYN